MKSYDGNNRSKADESYSESWDAERAYKRVRSMVIQSQAAERPTDSVLLVEREYVQMALCANGTCPPDLFRQALSQLEKHHELAVGDRYLSHPKDRIMATAAIEYTVEEDDTDTKFIGSMNSIVNSGVFKE